MNFIRPLLIVSILFVVSSFSETVVEKYGQLEVDGPHIVNEEGEPVMLAGNSLFWSQWGGEFWNEGVVRYLKYEWKATIIRASMAIEEEGYIYYPEEKDKVTSIIDICIREGLYVVVDWHTHFATDYEDEAITFFTEIAEKYGHHPNIIYEIYNEPGVISWSDEIKPYSEKVIKAIRKHDPDNIIILGNPVWDQRVNEAWDDPVDDKNSVYSLHFYVGSHSGELRYLTQSAIDRGAPVIVSEWGVWGEDWEFDEWVEFMRKNKLSWLNWAVTDKVEPTSILKPGAPHDGDWNEEHFTPVGLRMKGIMREWWETTGLPDAPPEQIYSSSETKQYVVNQSIYESSDALSSSDMSSSESSEESSSLEESSSEERNPPASTGGDWSSSEVSSSDESHDSDEVSPISDTHHRLGRSKIVYRIQDMDAIQVHQLKSGFAEVSLYNMSGQIVTSVFKGNLAAGFHSMSLKGSIPDGLYILMIK